MGRKEPCQNKHTSPETAGRDNIDVELLPKEMPEFAGTFQVILDGQRAMEKKRKAYKGKWTEQTFTNCVQDYFTFSGENDIKPCKAGLRLWLGCNRDTYWEWEKHPEKWGYKSDILKSANDFMELQYISRLEKYPTGNAFLLRTSHNHIEASKLDITSNGQQMITSEDEITEMVAKLGLDK